MPRKNIRTLCASLALLFPLTAAAIVGGRAVEPTVADALVNIKLKNGMCSGTMIAPNVVLTAAHCRDLFGEPRFVAQIDDGPTQPCDISPVVAHAYAPGALPELPMRVHAPDLLLLRLEKPLCHAQPAAYAREDLVDGETALGAGHGRGNPRFGQATAFELRLIPAAEAAGAVRPLTDAYRELLEIGGRIHRYALAVRAGASFCFGDSGGPVYRIDEDGGALVFAVNSAVLPHEEHGTPGCERAYLQLMTPVAPHAAWIESQLREWAR